MTKTILLTATAIAAIGFAGAANAQVVSTAEVSNTQVRAAGAGSAVTPFTVASESKSDAANRRTTIAVGDNIVTFTTNETGGNPRALQRGTTYRVTYALTGSATPAFLAQVTTDAFQAATPANNVCITNKQIVSGTGGGGSSSVSFIFTVPTEMVNCTDIVLAATTAFTVDVPFQIAALGNVTATVSGQLDPSNTNPGAATDRFSATGANVQLVQSASGYRIFVDGTRDLMTNDGLDNADLLTSLSLGTSGAPFRSFTTNNADRIIGAGGFVAATPPALAAGNQVFANLAAEPLPAAVYTAVVNGDFSVIKPQLSTTDPDGGGDADVPVATNNLSATQANLSGARNVKLRVEGTPTTSVATAPRNFTLTITPTAPATTNAFVTRPDAIATAPLEQVELQGTTFVAPWVQSSNANYNTVIRLTNNGTSATGSVQLTIASPLGAPTRTVCTSAELPKLIGIAANGELAINSQDLTTCFGAFTRADVSITVLSLSTNLTAKLRIVNPGNVVSEQTLGRFSGTNVLN